MWYQQYTDDTQLHLAVHAGNTADGLSVLFAYINHIKQWYLLNPDKSEALGVGTANQLQATASATSIMSVAGVELPVADHI